MPYYHGQNLPHHMSSMSRINGLPLTPPEIWGMRNQQQQNYGIIGQSHYDHSMPDQHSNGRHSKHVPRYVYEHPPAPIYSQYQSHDYGYESQLQTLPPIRTHDLDRQVQAPIQPIQEPKEESVAGGVSSTLTYKMDQMIDFVTEMATVMNELHSQNFQFKDIDVCRSLQPGNALVAPAFRKYVSQLLTSTRLPISTIMLALHYLTIRMEVLQDMAATGPEANLFQMLTTSLMLASKFLDDNTFQNLSWAEVSHSLVADLNKHEVSWLIDMDWRLHFDVDAEFKTWFSCFERYAEAKKMQQIQSTMEVMKLNHQAENLRQAQVAARYPPQTPLYTPPSHYEASFGQVRERPNPWQQWIPPRTLSPQSANSSFPSTPADWFKNPSTGFGQQQQQQQHHSMGYSSRPLPPPQILSSNHSPYYGASGNYSQFLPTWNGHPNGCHCCHRSADYDRGHHPYSVQTMA